MLYINDQLQNTYTVYSTTGTSCYLSEKS